MKNRILAVFFVVSFVTVIGAAYFATPVFSNEEYPRNEKLNIILQYFKIANRNEDLLSKDDVVLIIEGKEFTKKTFENTRASLSLKGNIASDQQVIDDLLEKEVAYNEAIKRGLEVSQETAKNFAAETMKTILELGGENLEITMSLARNYNMTLEEYFASEQTIRSYQKALTIGKLREQVYNSVRIDESIPIEKRYELEKNAYDKLIKELESKASVIIKMNKD